MTRTYARKGRAGQRLTQPNRRKSPTECKIEVGTAQSGGRIVEPPCCAAFDSVRTKHATDNHSHRQTVAQLKILKKPTATQAIGPPALHR